MIYVSASSSGNEGLPAASMVVEGGAWQSVKLQTRGVCLRGCYCRAVLDLFRCLRSRRILLGQCGWIALC